MKVTVTQGKNLQSLMTVNIERNEVEAKKNEQLKDVRKKAEIKGFRKGMAPMGLIEKLYGMSAMQDSLNNLITDAINSHIKDNNLNLLGEPLPNEEKQKSIDLEKDQSFEFVYDIAFRPEINITLDKKDKVINYNIKPTADDLKKYKEDMLRQFGSLENADKAADDDFLVVDLSQGDKVIEKSYITLKTLDKDAKKLFKGKKVGDSLEVDVVKAFPNETDRASLLKIKKEEFDASNPIYKVDIKEVKTFKPAEENQDLYDRVFGKDVVKSTQQFDSELQTRLEAEYKQNSNFRLRRDLIDYMVKKAGVELPEAFLKRWLFTINQGKFTMEQIEKEFPLFVQDYTWQMVAGKIFADQKMKIDKDELLEQAKSMTMSQFAMYGMMNIPEDQLNQYAQELLKDGNQISRVYEKCEEDKVLDYVKGVITITDKDITPAELEKQMNKK